MGIPTAPDTAGSAPLSKDTAGQHQAGADQVRFSSNISGAVYFVGDLLCLAASGPLSLFAYAFLVGSEVKLPVHVFAFAVAACAFVLIRQSRDSYRLTLTSRGDDFGTLIVDATVSTLLACAIVWQFGIIGDFSRGVTLLFLAFFTGSLLISRPLVKRYLNRLASRGAIQQRIAFYGTDFASGELIAQLIGSVRLPHVRFIGVADDRPRLKPVVGLPFLGGCAELADLARQGEVDQVLIAVPKLPRKRLHNLVESLSEVCVDVSLIPADAIDLAPNYTVRLLGTIPVLNLWHRPFKDINQLVKRAEDLTVGVAALLLLSPVMLLTALLVRVTSPGPVLFIQPRLGFNNELIQVFKFRTMYADALDLHARATTTRDDPRVTGLGRILRRLSLDELPQLLNVLRGDMSLVGPRPHAIEMKVEDRYYQDAVRGYAGRHRVRPGMTGLAQVRGLRGEIRTLERAKRRVEFDKEYIDTWSIWLDLWILVATVRAVFYDNDAY